MTNDFHYLINPEPLKSNKIEDKIDDLTRVTQILTKTKESD